MRKNELGMTDQEYLEYLDQLDAMSDAYNEDLRLYGPGDPEDDFHEYSKTAA